MNYRLGILLAGALLFQTLQSQTIGGYYVSARGVYAAPLGSLSDWFKPAPGMQVAVGTRSETDLTWEINAEAVTYSKANADKLFYRDLDLKLELYGIGAQVQYALTRQSPVTPYVTAGVTVYRWFGTRGRHALDSAQTQIVWDLKQSDWSAGFTAGAGLDAAIVSGLSVNGTVRYHIVNGELWPALALHLENVSAMQSVQVVVGFQYEFEL